jgi:hypothetical protein
MDEFDTDGDGMMDIDEFKVMMHVLYTGQRKKGIFDTIKSLFQNTSHAIFQHDILTDREIEKLVVDLSCFHLFCGLVLVAVITPVVL